MSDPFCWCCIPNAPREPVTYPPPRLWVTKLGPSDDGFDTLWYWAVWHYEDRLGTRASITTRWGRTSRWEDALSGGLAALARELGYEPVILGRETEPVVYVDEMGPIMVDRLNELVDRLNELNDQLGVVR